VSEYQYYEFQALDKTLSSEDKTYIRSLSSRVKLTATNAQFNYSYGDFHGKTEQVLDRCFDLMVYVASFGTRRLMIRLPKALVNPANFEPYGVEHCISISTTPKSVILDINLNSEDYNTWIDDDNEWLSGLVGLREELLKSDLRVLYLAWLGSCFGEDCAEDPKDIPEPPVPANLKKLSPALKNFVELFMVDEDLIAAAAESSPSRQAHTEPIEDWIAALSEADRNSYLLRIAQGETHVREELMQHLRKRFSKSEVMVKPTSGRYLADLIAIAETKKTERKNKEKQVAAKAKQKRLAAIAPKESALWEQVFDLIQLKQSKPYDDAIKILQDLRDLAEYQGNLALFHNRIQQMKQEYSNRPGLLTRLQKASLLRK
jgi:hypothetical protein